MALGQFSPGPDMILLTRTALRSGARAGVKMALGIACGLSVHATLAVGGLALAFERLPLLRGALRWVAAVYLMWLAYRMLSETFVTWYSERCGGKAGFRLGDRPVHARTFLQFAQPESRVVSSGGERSVSERRETRMVAVRDLGNRRRAGGTCCGRCGRGCCSGGRCGPATSARLDGSTRVFGVVLAGAGGPPDDRMNEKRPRVGAGPF